MAIGTVSGIVHHVCSGMTAKLPVPRSLDGNELGLRYRVVKHAKHAQPPATELDVNKPVALPLCRLASVGVTSCPCFFLRLGCCVRHREGRRLLSSLSLSYAGDMQVRVPDSGCRGELVLDLQLAGARRDNARAGAPTYVTIERHVCNN